MSKKKISKKEVLDYPYELPLEEFTTIVKDYDKKHKANIWHIIHFFAVP